MGSLRMQKETYQTELEERKTGRCRGRRRGGSETYIWREEGGEYKGRRKSRGERLPRWRTARGNIACWPQAPSNHATISSIASPSSSTSVSSSPRPRPLAYRPQLCSLSLLVATAAQASASRRSQLSSTALTCLRSPELSRPRPASHIASNRLAPPTGHPARCPAPPRRFVAFAVTFAMPLYARHVPPSPDHA